MDGVESSSGSFWPCEGSGLARISGLLVDGLIMLTRHFSGDFAIYQPLRSQHSPIILCLDSNCGLPPFRSLSLAHPTTHPPSTPSQHSPIISCMDSSCSLPPF